MRDKFIQPVNPKRRAKNALGEGVFFAFVALTGIGMQCLELYKEATPTVSAHRPARSRRATELRAA